jgi:dipeptidyl aminopeptidase/acylaminoacyl peptidase
MRRLFTALAAFIGFPLAVAWVVSEQVIHPRRRVEDHDLDDFDLPAEPIEFASRDGTRLAGWFIPARNAERPAPGIVLSHGWARSRCELLPHADFLHRAGFAVLMFDYRNRGLSEGDSITMGVKERGDLLAALEIFAARPEVDASRIGIFGMSLGGVIAILAGSRDARVRAIVAECPFASHETILTRSLRHYANVPMSAFAPFVRWMLERRFGEPLHGVEPISFVAAFAPRPLLIIGDQNDAVVGVEDSRRLFDAAGEPKRFWLIPHADHARGWQEAGEEYERRVVDFFSETLGAGAAVAATQRATSSL